MLFKWLFEKPNIILLYKTIRQKCKLTTYTASDVVY